MCYGETCDMSFAEELALRRWYNRPEAPSRGEVVLREAFPSAEDLGADTGGGFSPTGWLFWVACAAAALAVAVLIGVFKFMSSKKKSTRASALQDPNETQSTLSDKDSYRG